MRDLEIRVDRGRAKLTIEDRSDFNSKILLRVCRFGWWKDNYHLTPKRAEQLRDWLTRWLDEQKKRKAE